MEGNESLEEQVHWDEHAKVLDELLTKCRSKGNQDDLEKTDASLFVHPCKNEHIRKTELFQILLKADTSTEGINVAGLRHECSVFVQYERNFCQTTDHL